MATFTSAYQWRRIALALCIVLLSTAASIAEPLPGGKPEEVGLSSERLAHLSTVMRKYVADGQLAGSVVLIARRGKVAYLESFGLRDREARAPMRSDAVFRIASQTKAIVSVGILTLQEEGRLTLSDPVWKYLPEFRETTVAVPRRDGSGYDVVKAKRAITIRDLLTHTSGIGYGDGLAADRWKAARLQGWYFADRDEPARATIARMAALPFDAQPGEQWVYGFSTDILGVLIERVSGKPLDEFLRERILAPLHMQDTHFYLPPEQRDRLAAVYSATDGGGIERAPNSAERVAQGAYIDGPRKSFSGGAGLLSTAGDYARFLQMMLNDGELDGARILGRKSVELMTANHIGDIHFEPGQGFGLGFSVVRDAGARGVPGSAGEYGWGGAYHSVYWVDPREQLVVVYFTQLLPDNGLDDQDKLRALVYQAIID